MTALFLKEYRSLIPLQVVMILSGSGDLLYRPWLERLDQASWTHISSYIEPGTGSMLGVILAIFGLLVAYSLFPREHDDGTIEFLYSLPVPRWKIFLAKVLAGVTVLAVSAVVLQFTDWLQQSPNPQSFTGEQWRLQVAVVSASLQLSVSGVVLCHGVLISFLRRFGLIPYALVGWLVLTLERLEPSLAGLNFVNLLDLRYEGGRALVPWGPLTAHLLVAAAALGVAYLLWMGVAERFVAWWSRLREAAAGKVALGCATALVVVVLGSLAIALMTASVGGELLGGGPEELRTTGEHDPGTDRVETDRFVFTFPRSQRDRALKLAAGADALHERMRQRLDAEVGAKVVVDLTEESSHHEGITSWTVMRVGLAGEPDDRRVLKVLAHELVHAFQFQISDGKMAENGRATRAFAEGSAEHLAHWLVPDPELERAARRTALAAWERHEIRFEELADDDRLRADFDTLLVYTLGQTWVAALVDACGEGSIGRALRAMSRDDAPRDLAPLPFWQDTLRAAECDFEAVGLRWSEMMSQGVEQEREFLDLLPRLGGGVARGDRRMITVLATLDRPPLPADRFPEVRYQLRVRSGPGASDVQLRGYRGRVVPETDGRRVEFRVPRAALPGRRFQIQLGIRFHPEVWGWFERWQWAEAP